MKLFSKHKKAQFMSVLQAILSLLICVAVIIVLHNKFGTFPKVNEVPTRLQIEELTAQDYYTSIHSLRQTEVRDFSDNFLTGKGASRKIEPPLKLETTCVSNERFLLSSNCQNYISDLYLANLRLFISKPTLYENHELYLIVDEKANVESSYRLEATQFSPIRKAVNVAAKKINHVTPKNQKGAIIGATLSLYEFFKQELFEINLDSIANEELDDNEFNILPTGNMMFAYRYKKDFTFDFRVPTEMITLFELDKYYNNIRNSIIKELHLIKNQHTAPGAWEIYLYTPQGASEETALIPIDIIMANLENSLRNRFPVLKDESFSLTVDENSVTITFLKQPIEIQVTY